MSSASMVMLPETSDSSTMVVPTMIVISPEPYTEMMDSGYTLPGLLMMDVEEIRGISSTSVRYQKGVHQKLTAKQRWGFPHSTFQRESLKPPRMIS